MMGFGDSSELSSKHYILIYVVYIQNVCGWYIYMYRWCFGWNTVLKLLKTYVVVHLWGLLWGHQYLRENLRRTSYPTIISPAQSLSPFACPVYGWSLWYLRRCPGIRRKWVEWWVVSGLDSFAVCDTILYLTLNNRRIDDFLGVWTTSLKPGGESLFGRVDGQKTWRTSYLLGLMMEIVEICSSSYVNGRAPTSYK